MASHFADIRVDVRIYFDDNGLDSLPDQAVENFDCLVGLSDREGELEIGGIEVVYVSDEKVRS